MNEESIVPAPTGAAPAGERERADVRTGSGVVWFTDVGLADVDDVGGKNASLGEMMRHLTAAGLRVPDGFATTAAAYRAFLAANGLDRRIAEDLARLDVDDVGALQDVGARIRTAIEDQPFPADLETSIREAHARLSGTAASATGDGAEAELSCAVRSSATAEDLPDASFAGQQETFLNVRGIDQVLTAVKRVYASLYNDRAIAYRAHSGYQQAAIALSVGVQRMVRSDLGAAGVMFTIDTESGFADAVLITSGYGLGEGVVQGAVNPDEYYVYKPALRQGRPAILKRALGTKATKMIYTDDTAVGRTTRFTDVEPDLRRRFSLTDDEVTELAQAALQIEAHYQRPMDIEWGKDGQDGRLYILQARPETVQSRRSAASLRSYRLDPGEARVLVEGRAIGRRVGAGAVRVLTSPDQMNTFRTGEVLVADMTDPDWEPIMKRAAAVVTDRGGRTCHAAIIARELGIPAVVGTATATRDLPDGREVTVSCAQGETGIVYDGRLDVQVSDTELETMPEPPVKVMMNVGNPEQAFEFSRIPNHGVGLARLEFIINRQIGIHPRALLDLAAGRDHTTTRLTAEVIDQIRVLAAAYPDPRSFFVQRVAEGVSTIAAAFAPKPVIVRLSDFKSNEYANLLGGTAYEPHEENPMLGYRGASRYLSADFADCFAMECEALRYVRDVMGLTNLAVMIPFVRTVAEVEAVVDLLARHGLVSGQNDLQIMMMCEIPSNALLADAFLDHVDGFSIGSNDLTQLTLGLDRDSALVAAGFDERDPAVRHLLSRAITACRRRGKYVGICGQGPSDHPDLAQWLTDEGIESISLNPDTVTDTWLRLARAASAQDPS